MGIQDILGLQMYNLLSYVISNTISSTFHTFLK